MKKVPEVKTEIPMRKRNRVFTKQSEYIRTERSMEKQSGKSKTVPNQAYSVSELLNKHRQGISPAIMKQALFEMDHFGEDINPLRKPGLDLTDLDDISRQIEETYRRMKVEDEKRKISQKEQEKRQIIENWIKESKEKEVKTKTEEKTNSSEKL